MQSHQSALLALLSNLIKKDEFIDLIKPQDQKQTSGGLSNAKRK
tara:strand:- start:319 stop:450 length:132 start_codon:yes stop_codon:yes gene_type:complete